jgi:hypothetical protein
VADSLPPRPHAGPRDPAAEAAMRLGAAWTACDMPAAMALSLTYEELVALTSKPIDRAEWNRDTHDFIDQRCREFAQSHGHVITATVVKTEHHDRGTDTELKVDVDITFVQFVIEENGQANLRGTLLPFVRTPDGFKFVSKP